MIPNLTLYANGIEAYLRCDKVIDYDDEAVAKLADTLFEQAQNELDFIRRSYEFVRDRIAHSADAGEDALTCAASEVLRAGHGICFAKSHLLAALLRCKSVPAGFCYQKLILDDETAPVLVYHGLNGVYLREYQKWIRLDARGNKAGVNAQFSVETEQLAFAVRPELGEEDDFAVYPDPDKKVVERLKKYRTRTELWKELPTELAYQENTVKEERVMAITPVDIKPSPNGRLSKEMAVYELLEKLDIPYLRVDHEAAATVDDCHGVDEALGIHICKNLFLCNRQKTDFYLLMMPGLKKFKTKELSAQLGVARLSFAEAEYMEEFLDITPGSVSVLGLMNDKEHRVRLLIDSELLQDEFVGCHPCVNTSSLKLRMQDILEKFLPYVEHEYTAVELVGEE